MRTGVPHGEPLTDGAADERLTTGGTEQDHVAADDVVFGEESLRCAFGGTQHDPATGQTLADIVVGVAVHPQRDTARQERTEAIAGRAVEGDVDGAVRQAFAAIGFRHLMAQHGSDRAVGIGDLHRELHRRTRIQGLPASDDQLLIQSLVQTVILTRTAVQILVHEGRVSLM